MALLSGQKVLIIGAGIAGLAMARALAMRGAEVQILEQTPAIREVGAGIQIAPNGTAVLRGLGLGAELARVGMRAQAVELRNGQSGAAVATMDLTRRAQDREYFFVHRADLIELLRHGAETAGAVLTLGAKVASLDTTGPRAVVAMADGQRVAGDIIIGADGLHSVVRSTLNKTEAPFFTGQVAWRATIPGDGGPNIVQVFMAAGRHLVSYPLRGGTLRNIVAVQERSAWTAESWTQRADHARFAASFADFTPQVRSWIDAARDAGLWGLFRHPMAENWAQALPQGGVFVLGDAAHPTLPFLAQGASMGLEDGVVLASLLDRVPIAAAALRFRQQRAPRVDRILRAADSNARNYHLSGPARVLAHSGLRVVSMLAPSLLLRRFDWLYSYDATQES